MATSISKSVNYKQAAAAPDYQVAARPVDTFVSGSGNDTLSKGRQVAAALEQASGAVARYGQVQAKLSKEQEAAQKAAEAKAYAELVKDDSLTAKLLSDRFKPLAKSFVENYDFSAVDGKRPTLEDAYNSFLEANPEYSANLNNLQTKEGRIAAHKVVGGIFNETFGTAELAFKTEERKGLLDNHIANELSNPELDNFSSLSPEWQTAVEKLDIDIQSFDEYDRVAAYTMLADRAYLMAFENQDYRLYEYLQGNNTKGLKIGGSGNQKAWAKEVEAIKAHHEKEQDELKAERAAQQKVLTGDYAAKAAELFGKGKGNYTKEEVDALEDEAQQSGLDEPSKVLSRVKTAMENLEDIEPTLDSGQLAEAYKRFNNAPTVEAKLNAIDEMIVNNMLDKGTASTLLSRIANPQEGGRYKGTYYDNFKKRLTVISSQEMNGMWVDDEQHMYLRDLGTMMYNEAFNSDDWHQKTDAERIQIYNNIVNDLKALKEATKKDAEIDTTSERQDELDKIRAARIKAALG